MRKHLVALAFLSTSIFSTAGQAGDWNGLYAGVHAGYGAGDWNADLVHPFPAVPGGVLSDGGSLDASGWLGGAQIGANAQYGSWVLGIEADVSKADFDDEKAFRMDFDTDWETSLDLEVFGTIRGRLGYASNSLLLYATGGLAWGRGEMAIDSISITGPVHMAALSEKAYHVGWTAGLGGEWLASKNISIKAEWLYVDLGEADYDPKGAITPQHGGLPAGTPWHELASADIDFHTFRVGLNYQFGGREAATPLK